MREGRFGKDTDCHIHGQWPLTKPWTSRASNIYDRE